MLAANRCIQNGLRDGGAVAALAAGVALNFALSNTPQLQSNQRVSKSLPVWHAPCRGTRRTGSARRGPF